MPESYVYIVESPSPSDLADGRTEGQALCENFKLSQTRHSYSMAANKAEFIRALSIETSGTKFNSEFVRNEGRPPIVHLSMHGDNRGIQLTDYTIIEWQELREILSPINNALPDGLMVTFSTCGGAASICMSMSESVDHKAFYATVGSFDTIPWDDALVGYIAFYHNWFKNKTLQECVNIMKIASGHDGFQVYSGAQQKQEFIAYAQRQRLIEALTRPTASVNAPATGGPYGLLNVPQAK